MDKRDNYIVLYTQLLSIHEEISLFSKKKKKFAVLLLVINIPDRLYEGIYMIVCNINLALQLRLYFQTTIYMIGPYNLSLPNIKALSLYFQTRRFLKFLPYVDSEINNPRGRPILTPGL
jgi:hypothetical protein